MKYKISTKVFYNGIVEQDIEDLRGRVAREVMDTKDQQIRKALISLGWTPPDEPSEEN